MWRSLVLFAVIGCSVLLSSPVLAEAEIPDATLRQRMDELAASTMVGSADWRVYEQFLHAD